MRRLLLTLGLSGLLLIGAPAALPTAASAAVPPGCEDLSFFDPTHPPPPSPVAQSVRITGAVARPRTWTPAQLLALPQTTVVDAGGFDLRCSRGVSLLDLVLRSGPQLPGGARPEFRMAVTATGRSENFVTPAIAFASGELTPDGAGSPVLLTVGPNGYGVDFSDEIALVVPDDPFGLRMLHDLRGITINVLVPPVLPAPAPGEVVLTDGTKAVTLSPQLLNGLAPRTSAGGSTGPQLWRVLQAAGIPTGPQTLVTAVSSTGAAAAVSLGEVARVGTGQFLALYSGGGRLSRPTLMPGHAGADPLAVDGRVLPDVTVLSVTGAGPLQLLPQ